MAVLDDKLDWVRRRTAQVEARRKESEFGASGAPWMSPWAKQKCAIPNIALRSSLFSSLPKGPRSLLKRAVLPSQKGFTIFFTGEQLDQCDLDVWESIVFESLQRPLGSHFTVTAYQLLKIQGRSLSGSNRSSLFTRLLRLKATALEVQCAGGCFVGSLLEEFWKDAQTGLFTFRLSSTLITLFQKDTFTFLHRPIRHALRGKPLSQWLHGYYSSHAKPFPIKVESIHLWCGSQSSNLRDFKKDLVRSLSALATAYEEVGQKFSFEIKEDLVVVTKTVAKKRQKPLRGKPG